MCEQSTLDLWSLLGPNKRITSVQLWNSIENGAKIPFRMYKVSVHNKKRECVYKSTIESLTWILMDNFKFQGQTARELDKDRRNSIQKGYRKFDLYIEDPFEQKEDMTGPKGGEWLSQSLLSIGEQNLTLDIEWNENVNRKKNFLTIDIAIIDKGVWSIKKFRLKL